jgi:hypothetical protein
MGNIDEIFNFLKIQFESRRLEDTCATTVSDDNPGDGGHNAPLNKIDGPPS